MSKAAIPYDNYDLYIYLHRRENRKMAILVSPSHRTSTSYARYLMATKLGRLLTKEEQVDHIDGNTLNDVLDNLQILSPLGNIQKSFCKDKTYSCPICSKVFTPKRRQSGRGNPCCSRKCGGLQAIRTHRLTVKTAAS